MAWCPKKEVLCLNNDQPFFVGHMRREIKSLSHFKKMTIKKCKHLKQTKYTVCTYIHSIYAKNSKSIYYMRSTLKTTKFKN